jgi:hypothetical protein
MDSSRLRDTVVTLTAAKGGCLFELAYEANLGGVSSDALLILLIMHIIGFIWSW